MKRVLLSLLLLCAACSKAPEKAPEAPPAKAAPAVTLPADQKALIDAAAAVRAAPDDQTVYKRFCDLFEAQKTFDGWHASITDSQVSTVNGSIDVTFDIGHLRLEQVVQMNDPLHTTLTDLDGRQSVFISGSFPHRDGAAECGYYRGTLNIVLSKVQ